MENSDNLLSVIRMLWQGRKTVIWTTVATGIGAALISLFLPVYYKATTIFYAASPDLAMPERIFGMTNEAMEYYGEDEDIDRILTIATSSELKEYLIRTFNLYERYEIDTANVKAPYHVGLKLEKLYEVQKTKYDALELSVEDKDKQLATDMANAARKKIDEIAQRLIKSSQSEVIKTYETNISEKGKELAILNDSLENMRARYGVFNTETQSELLATLAATAEARLANASARLEGYRADGNAPRDSITVLRATIRGAEREVKTLQEKLSLFNQGMAQVDVLTALHIEASDQLSEDQERYKQVKTAYQSYFPTIHLVEEATVPVIKSRPKRMFLTLAATMAAFVLSSLGVLLLGTYRMVNWKDLVNGR